MFPRKSTMSPPAAAYKKNKVILIQAEKRVMLNKIFS
jgi:hypothetical protein